MQHADKVRFVADEDGWELHVTDEDGVRTRFNIHGIAWDLAAHAHETIGAWRAEGEQVRNAMRMDTGEALSVPEWAGGDPPELSLERLRDSGAADLMRDLERGK